MSLKGKSGLSKGDVLKGKYEILALIGEGGMSRVYLARDLELSNKQWAVKEVDRRATDPSGRPIEQSLASEAELLSKLQHPAIVSIVDIEKTKDYIYVVMDHVEGDPLDKVVREGGPQSEEDVQDWMLQVCDALGYLHRQEPPIIYRDMKPNNVMLHPDGYVKLIDLGVAREYKDDAKKDTIAFGTTGYAAPEQYGKAQSDARSDIYGIGATLWHLLAGTPPPVEFPLPNVRERNPEVGEGFADVIIPKCTQLEREGRYASCEELAADLEAYQELTREFRARQKRKVVSFAATAIAGVALIALGFGLLALRDATMTENYEHHMQIADAQYRIDSEAAAEEYLAAIGIRPGATDAYLGLINCYEQDGRFTPEEKQQLDQVYDDNLSALQNSRFAELSYELGRLYWYFYAYGQTGTYEGNQPTRVKASTEYFANAAADDAFENHATAETYYSIAKFTSDIDKAVMSGDEDQELYTEYWEALEKLADRVGSEPLEIVKLDSCVLIANSIETYLSKFKDIGGLPRERVEALASTVTRELEDMSLTTEENRRAREAALSRLRNDVRVKMATAYSRSIVPGREG